IVASANPCYLTAGLLQDGDGRLAQGAEEEILGLAQVNDVVALGPGLGRSKSLTQLIASLIGRLQLPLVLDANGLNALDNPTASLKKRRAATILTPHPGEFARLLQTTVTAVQAQRSE